MKWCRFTADGATSYGLIEGESVSAVEGPPWGKHEVTREKHALKSVKLLAPIIPGTFYCAGVNYRNHVIKMAAKRNASASSE